MYSIFKFLFLLSLSFSSYSQESMADAECYNSIIKNPELQKLKEKIALGSVNDQTFHHLAIREYSTQEENELIVKWMEMRAACDKINAEVRKKLPSPFRELSESVLTTFQDLTLKLIDKEINYGEFAKLRRDAKEKLKNDWANAQKNEVAYQRNQRQINCEQSRRNVEIYCNSGDTKIKTQIDAFYCGQAKAQAMGFCK